MGSIAKKKKRKRGHDKSVVEGDDCHDRSKQTARTGSGVEGEPRFEETVTSLAAVPTPSQAQMQALPDDEQVDMLRTLASHCEVALHCINDGINAVSYTNEKVNREADVQPENVGQRSGALEDAVLADMARLRGVPFAKEYMEISLWRRLRAANQSIISEVSRELSTSRADGMLASRPGEMRDFDDPTASQAWKSFRQVHLQNLTDKYTNDLEAVRRSEEADSGKVRLLLRCLESGADLYASMNLRESRDDAKFPKRNDCSK